MFQIIFLFEYQNGNARSIENFLYAQRNLYIDKDVIIQIYLKCISRMKDFAEWGKAQFNNKYNN